MRSGVRVWLATGHTDMTKGVQGLALLVQEDLRRDPHVGDLSLIKILWHDGVGMSLYAKRLERGRLVWPSASLERSVGGVAHASYSELGRA